MGWEYETCDLRPERLLKFLNQKFNEYKECQTLNIDPIEAQQLLWEYLLNSLALAICPWPLSRAGIVGGWGVEPPPQFMFTDAHF